MALTNAPVVAYGLKSLSVADLGKISTATPTQIGYVLENSCKLNFDAPTANAVKVEELSMPLLNKFEQGGKSIEVDLVNVEKSLLTLLGCTVTTGASEDVVAIPDSNVILKKMVKFEFLSGAKALWFTNAQITWNFSGTMTKTGTETFNIHMTITPNAGLGGATYEATGLVMTTVGTGA